MIENAHLYCGDAMDFYDQWATPMVNVLKIALYGFECAKDETDDGTIL